MKTSLESRADDDLESPSETTEQQEVEEAANDADATTEEDAWLDIVFDILKNRRRRLTLQYLEEHEGPIDIDELAVHIAAVENEKSIGEVTAAERKRVYVALYQWHLQKMADVDIINTDRNLSVEQGPNADQVAKYLQIPEQNSVRWYRYYGAIAGVAGLVTLPQALGMVPDSLLTDLLIMGTFLGVVACAIIHARSED